MRGYWAIVSARFRALLQYRMAAVAGLTTQIFWGLIRVMVFAAFYRSATSNQPMTYSQVVVYIWLGQAMLRLQPWDVDGEVWSMIRSGSVVFELLRPMDLYALWFSRAIAQRTAPTILRAIPMFIIAGLFFGLEPPPSLASACAYIIALGGACMFGGLFVFQATLAFWTIESLEMTNTLTYGGVETAQYPLSVYRPWFRRFFTFVVPLVCVNFFPSLAILGRGGASGIFYWLAPVVGVAFMAVSPRAWQFGVRHYCSTGS